MKAAVVAALLALPVAAQHYCPPPALVISAAAEGTEYTKADALAIGWVMGRAHYDVRISVHAETGFDDHSIVTAYLMRQIGPSTSKSAEVARTSYELPPWYNGEWVLFEDLDLPAGEYWLVFERPPQATHDAPEWLVSRLSGFQVQDTTRFLGTRYYSYVNYRTDYIPDATYTTTMKLQGYAIAVSGVPVD